MFRKRYQKHVKQISSVSIVYFLFIFTLFFFFGGGGGAARRIPVEIEKSWPNFISFNPCPSVTSVVADNKKCLNIALKKKNWTIIVAIQIIRTQVSAF